MRLLHNLRYDIHPHAFILAVVAVVSFTGCFGPPRSVTEPDGVRILRDWTYATVDGEDLQLDLYCRSVSTNHFLSSFGFMVVVGLLAIVRRARWR